MPLRILLVDDSADSRCALRHTLEGWGYQVEEADDGLEGVKKALAWKPDAALVDIDMPVVDGYALARRVRDALGSGIRLIALTGLDAPERALAAGFDAHLLKPVEPEKIRQVVQDAGFATR